MFFLTRHLHIPICPAAPQHMSLCLQPTVEGCALVDEHDAVVFEAEGRDARRECLSRARMHGALYLRFHELPIVSHTAESQRALSKLTDARSIVAV